MTWFTFQFEDFALSFLSILFEGVPFLLAGTLISGAIDAFLPANVFERFNPRRPVAGVLAAAALPMLLPMCECGVVPVARRLIKKGFPPACAVAYMIAAPVVNPVVAASTFAAFNGGFSMGSGGFFEDGSAPGTMAVLRVLLGFLVAILAASVAMQFDPRTWLAADVLPEGSGAKLMRSAARAETAGGAEGSLAPLAPTFGGKAIAAARCASADFLDVSFFLVIGAAITATFNTAVDQSVVAPVATHPIAATAAMMGLAFGLALCSTSDAFIAATFTMFPMASKLAFLVFGPVADVKLIFLYGMLFRRRVIAGFVLGAFLLIGAMSLRVMEVVG